MNGEASASGDDAISIMPVDRLDLRFAPRPWRFAMDRRREIDAFFADRQKLRSGMWNGRVLLMRDFSFTDGALGGAFFETDYAAFYTWCSWGFPDRAVTNCFAAGALRSADGAFVLGEMGPHTANAGHIYFPCGTPDPGDVAGSRVDLDGSVRRELFEEIGVGESDYHPDPGWFAIHAGPRIALIKVLRAHESADLLSRRIDGYLAREAAPELAGIRIVRSTVDFDPLMPTFVTAFLSHYWGR
ncbi:MAG: NUDIX hydrolase [Rhizobiales bacterium]|nr:NUDIX hydrolase [Hyphomicrobiales bacterium]